MTTQEKQRIRIIKSGYSDYQVRKHLAALDGGSTAFAGRNSMTTPQAEKVMSVFPSELLRSTFKGNWHTVEIKTPNSYTLSEDGYEYTLVCTHSLDEMTEDSLMKRVCLMLCSQLASARQDVNGLMLKRCSVESVPEGQGVTCEKCLRKLYR